MVWNVFDPKELISHINCDVTAGVCTHAQCQRRSACYLTYSNS